MRPSGSLVGILSALCVLAVGCGSGSAPFSAPSTTSPPPPLRDFTVAAVGDILIHVPVMRTAQRNAGGSGYDFGPMFDDVRPMITAADFAICHQETPISPDNTRLSTPNTKIFNAPKEIAPALKGAGFDACDVAGNHIYDRGLTGMKDTLDVLQGAGLATAGGSRSEEEAVTAPIHQVNGVALGHLAYSYTIYNNGGPNTQVPPDAPWLRTILWPAVGVEGIRADAAALRARGAEFVVVSMHWGDQYETAPTAQQKDLAEQLLAAPEVDLIIGDHVHLVQPCQKINGKYVAYGMGNFLSNQSPSQDRSLKPATQDGTINTFAVKEVERGRFVTESMTYAPTYVAIPGHVVKLATPAAYPQSYERTLKAMTSLGDGACDAVPAY